MDKTIFSEDRKTNGDSGRLSATGQGAENTSAEFMDQFISLDRGIERLISIGTLKKYPKDTILMRPGEITDHCCIVKTGRVVAYEYSYNGDLRIYNFMEPGSVLMEEFMLFDKPSPIYFKTTCESELYLVNKCAMKHYFKNDIDIVLDICKSITDKFLSAMDVQRYYPVQGATWKICNFFRIYARHYGVPADGRILLKRKISQQTIADLLGMNRVTVTRKIGQLEKAGLLGRENGFFVLESMDDLQRYMDSICFQDT